ncbi:MobA/MobL family protein [Acetobacter syzygii]|uniref:MobA/MobL protein domain-containing protein n=1 Tax=Acetobacter syzygii TaxID=146476 RepID=A0A270B4S2_9PROT|nr:MobA/MobL family protein [Acetobacter syzygii]PAL19978.1 hypothetical protein B9K05_13485 [Acetobacter syzygii]PAL20860.1 hypothetical protein B9K04_13425 [Acetobacter syzygii]
MAIYSVNVSSIGRKTHASGTAGAHVQYITRASATEAVLCARMPSAGIGRKGGAARKWLDEQESSDRKNARVVTKIMLALPHELDATQRAELVRSFAERMTAGRASWLAALHKPSGDDDRNYHAHLVIRDKDPETGKVVVGLSAKNSVEMIREEWEQAANAALEAAGVDERVDRRSLKDQGEIREPGAHVGPSVTAIERRGHFSQVRNRIEEQQAGHAAAQETLVPMIPPDIWAGMMAGLERQKQAEDARRAAQAAEDARRAAQAAEDARRAAQAAEDARRAAQAAEDARRAAQAAEDARRAAQAARNAKRREILREAQELVERIKAPVEEIECRNSIRNIWDWDELNPDWVLKRKNEFSQLQVRAQEVVPKAHPNWLVKIGRIFEVLFDLLGRMQKLAPSLDDELDNDLKNGPRL